MKKFILSLLFVLGLFVAQAQTNQSLFAAKELSLSLGTGYVADYNVTSVKDAFADEYEFNLTAGAQYFVTRHFGIEAALPFYQTKGVSVSEVSFGGVARLPLPTKVVVLRNLAPYVGLGAVYGWQAEEHWTYVAKLGLEWRFNPKWGFFAEGQYRNVDFKFDNGATTAYGGLRLVF